MAPRPSPPDPRSRAITNDSPAAGVGVANTEASKLRIMPPAPFAYVDLFAGIGGFHAMLNHAGGHCVYVSEIDREARETYRRNWIDPLPDEQRPVLNTDIALDTTEDAPVSVPEHQVLAAGFPCQPFSKSGYQRGMDEARGTLFWNIARILEERTPAVVILENVRNIAGPRHRHEWETIIRTLREIGYRVSDIPTVFSPHFLPPHRGGTPQIRDRVFILGTYIGPERVAAELATGNHSTPTVDRAPIGAWRVTNWKTEWILDEDTTVEDIHKYKLSAEETAWVNVWDDLVQRIQKSSGRRLPGFPLWSDAWVPERTLDLLEMEGLPAWKRRTLIKNAAFYDSHRTVIDEWRHDRPEFQDFPASRRKLEWQSDAMGSLWDTVMHFRPSGIRAKAATYLPALVAITQTSIYGPRRRRLTPHEAARLQGFPRPFTFGPQRDSASYKQVGNGVAVGAAWHVFRSHVARDAGDLPEALVDAVLRADLNPTGDALSPEAYEAYEAKGGLQAS